MKIDYISDIHIDFWINETKESKKLKKLVEKYINSILPKEIGDILIVAGDLGHYETQIEEFFSQMLKFYKDIFVVLGNHDLYLISKNISKKYNHNSFERANNIKKILSTLGINVLDGNVVEVKGIKIGGSMSWYHLPDNLDKHRWKNISNDSRKIYTTLPTEIYRVYTYGKSIVNNWDPNTLYKEELVKINKVAEEGCDVFVSHIALNEPSRIEGMPRMYINDPSNKFYFSDNIDILKKSGAKVHIFGHTHNDYEYKREGILFLANPLGYPGEKNNIKIKSIYLKGEK